MSLVKVAGYIPEELPNGQRKIGPYTYDPVGNVCIIDGSCFRSDSPPSFRDIESEKEKAGKLYREFLKLKPKKDS